MAGPAKTKVTAGKRGVGKKKPVKKKVQYFAYADASTIIDLKTNKLKIKQVVDFAKKAGDLEVVLSLWEMQLKGGTDRGKNYEVLKIKGKVTGAVFKVVSVEQDATKFPESVDKAGTKLWMPFKLELVNKTGGEIEGVPDKEFVLPPMEYDDVLEFQLGCSEGKAACGIAKVKYEWMTALLTEAGVVDKVGIGAGTEASPKPLPRGKVKKTGKDMLQKGRPKKIVIHSMSAINTVDRIEDCFSVAENLKLLKDNGFSAHFLIGRDGTIAHAVEVHKYAWHAGGHNSKTIGIELFGFPDDFRGYYANNTKKEEKKKKKAQKLLKTIETKLAAHETAKADGKTERTVNKKNIPVDTAISLCEDAIEKLKKQIKKHDEVLKERNDFIEDKNAGGVPLVFTYTDKQYESLGKLLRIFGKHYRYEQVVSHKSLSPARKKDPGMYFEWKKIEDYLLPGLFNGKKAGEGVKYTID